MGEASASELGLRFFLLRIWHETALRACRSTWEDVLTGSAQNNHIPLKISTNAGHFLCDYIYFNSLAQCYKSNERRRVAFLHVPAVKPEPVHQYEASIATGREIAIQLIRSIVESEVSKNEAGTQVEAELR